MLTYPRVLTERQTLEHVLRGGSLARYGDGEFKLAKGKTCVSQDPDPELAKRLRGILQDAGECLVGIPNIHSPTPKKALWDSYQWVAEWLNPAVRYGSSFVSRPGSAPWIDEGDYWEAMRNIWAGRKVVLVRGSHKSLTPERLPDAAHVLEIMTPRQHAWSDYARLLDETYSVATSYTDAVVLLCCGPTATVMAVDLCGQGVQAVDLGHVGMWLKSR